MIKLTQSKIKLPQDLEVLGEYEGNEESKKIVIFSHGFGVARDSRGMFTALGDTLKDKYLVVKFDYIERLDNKGSIKVLPYSEQVKKLNAVLNYVVQNFSPDSIDIVAHSMGSIIAGMKNDDIPIGKIILNAAPLNPIYERFKSYFLSRKGTVINEMGESKLIRSDDTVTYIERDFWPEAKNVNPSDLYRKLSQKSKVFYIKAKNDETVTDGYRNIENIELFEIPGDHDFSGDFRSKWVELNTQLLLGK